MQMIQHTGSYLFKQIVTECKSTYILSTCRDCLICLVAGARGGKKQNNSTVFPLKYALSSILIHSSTYTFGHLDV